MLKIQNYSRVMKFLNFEKNTKNQNHRTTHTTHFILISCLLFSSLVFRLLSSLVLFFISSSLSLSVFFLCHCLSVSVCCCVCCCMLLLLLLLWCVWCVCGVCVVVCGCVWWCGVTHWTTSVCRFKTSPCVPAPRAHVETHTPVPLPWKEGRLAIWLNHFLTQVRSPRVLQRRSEHTPINNPSRRNSFNIENDLHTQSQPPRTSSGNLYQQMTCGPALGN